MGRKTVRRTPEPIVRAPAAEPRPTLVERLTAGGYPEPLTRSPGRARQWHRQYLRSIIERDVRDVARVRDADDLGRLLELSPCAVRSSGTRAISRMTSAFDERQCITISPCSNGSFSYGAYPPGIEAPPRGSSNHRSNPKFTAIVDSMGHSDGQLLPYFAPRFVL